ncbi:MAG: 2-iminoacetate synthase ThiH, partial [Verrucomicrobia bacterium]|nr:2-iminoacetate synthase ThiH [Verrucomicrobiota bacterium]
MTFVAAFNGLELSRLSQIAGHAASADVESALARPRRSLADFAALISPAATP